ncbi:MAG: hypothetical protein ACR2MS_12715 [Weeksellaceae bacterium]
MIQPDHYLTYHPSMDELSDHTLELLEKAVESTQAFIKVTSKLSETSYLTRGAHAKSYAYAQGKFNPNEALIHDLNIEDYFNKGQDLLIRFSNANNVIHEESKNFPAYGMSLKFTNNICYPLVNFPLFPTDDVDSFLKLFIDLNEARISQAKEGWGAVKELPAVLSSTFKALYHINPLNLGNLIWKGASLDKDFLMNYHYHGIGCYRMGEYVAKIHTEKLDFKIDDVDKEGSQRKALQNILNCSEIHFRIYIQLAVNENDTPVNQLSKEWSKETSPWLELGIVTLPKQIIVENSPAFEATSFNPFLNPSCMQPVGRIQQTRKPVYKVSHKTRTSV